MEGWPYTSNDHAEQPPPLVQRPDPIAVEPLNYEWNCRIHDLAVDRRQKVIPKSFHIPKPFCKPKIDISASQGRLNGFEKENKVGYRSSLWVWLKTLVDFGWLTKKFEGLSIIWEIVTVHVWCQVTLTLWRNERSYAHMFGRIEFHITSNLSKGQRASPDSEQNIELIEKPSVRVVQFWWDQMLDCGGSASKVGWLHHILVISGGTDTGMVMFILQLVKQINVDPWKCGDWCCTY